MSQLYTHTYACIHLLIYIYIYIGLPWWLTGKESTCSAGDARDAGSILGLGRSPGGGHGNPVQYSCLKNPMDRGAWWVTVHGVPESGMTEVTEHAHTYMYIYTFICIYLHILINVCL